MDSDVFLFPCEFGDVLSYLRSFPIILTTSASKLDVTRWKPYRRGDEQGLFVSLSLPSYLGPVCTHTCWRASRGQMDEWRILVREDLYKTWHLIKDVQISASLACHNKLERSVNKVFFWPINEKIKTQK